MDTQASRLLQARAAAGFKSAREAAEKFEWNYSTYASHENGTRGFKLHAARKYARAFNVTLGWLMLTDKANEPLQIAVVRVAGEVAAGTWLEEADADRFEDLLVPASPRFEPSEQIALRVRGTSMNKVLSDGDIAIGVLFGYGRDIRDGDLVAVRRTRAGLTETTLKRYRETGGKRMLIPESTDPRYQEPIVLEASESDAMIEIVARIVGAYRDMA